MVHPNRNSHEYISWYVLFGSIDGNEPDILAIIINFYAYNENDIDFQVEMIKENEVKLISCQVYINFKSYLIEASCTDSTNTIKNSMFKFDNYDSFSKSGINSCANLLKHIATVMRYYYVRSKKNIVCTSSFTTKRYISW